LPRTSSPPTALLFDLSEVLIAGLRGVEEVLAPRLELPEDEILRRLGGDALRRLCRGEISESAYLRDVAVELGGALKLEELRDLIRGNFHHEVPGMPELVRRLKGAVDLVLVSDHAREWIASVRAEATGLRAVCFEDREALEGRLRGFGVQFAGL